MPVDLPPEQKSLIEYPSAFPIKVMGANVEGFDEAVIAIAQRFDPGFDAATVERRPSSAGHYLGLTITITATSREQLGACKVRHVITVEALKEGWDCSFAYVLCSLQSVRSGKDVEQLLGRVLRMPHARRRESPALNRAYAHVVARSFSEAAAALVDRMVAGMGFEALDAASVLLPDPGVPDLFGDMAPRGAVEASSREPVLNVELPASALQALHGDPDIALAELAVADDKEQPRVQATLRGEVSTAQLARLVAAAPPPNATRLRSRCSSTTIGCRRCVRRRSAACRLRRCRSCACVGKEDCSCSSAKRWPS